MTTNPFNLSNPTNHTHYTQNKGLLSKRQLPGRNMNREDIIPELLKLKNRQRYYSLIDQDNQKDVLEFWVKKMDFILFDHYAEQLVVSYAELINLLSIQGEVPDLKTILVRNKSITIQTKFFLLGFTQSLKKDCFAILAFFISFSRHYLIIWTRYPYIFLN